MGWSSKYSHLQLLVGGDVVTLNTFTSPQKKLRRPKKITLPPTNSQFAPDNRPINALKGNESSSSPINFHG